MIFVDSNVPMYLMGVAHPNKTDAQLILERLTATQDRLVTDAEMLQELIHRYSAIGRRDWIERALQLVLTIVDEVIPIEAEDALRAGEIAQLPARWSARDALHLAVMQRHGIRSIFTFDADFDRWPGLSRIHSV